MEGKGNGDSLGIWFARGGAQGQRKRGPQIYRKTRRRAAFLGGASPDVYHCRLAGDPVPAVARGPPGRIPGRRLSLDLMDQGRPLNRQFLNFVLMGLALAAVWLLLSGLLKPLLLGLALVSVLLCLWLAQR